MVTGDNQFALFSLASSTGTGSMFTITYSDTAMKKSFARYLAVSGNNVAGCIDTNGITSG